MMPDDDFGELRQLLNQPRLDRALFWPLVERKANEAPGVYFDQWLPYIQSFSHHFEEIYEHCLSMVLVERLTRVLPHLVLGLSINPYTALGSQGTQALANNPLLAHIKTLGLAANRIGVRGLKVLVQSPYIKQLERLNLSNNAIKDRGVFEIASSTQFGALTHLILKDNQCTAEGFIALAQAESMHALESLDWSHNALDAQTLESSLDTRGFPMLRTLELDECDITDESLAYLAQSAYMRGVVCLVLRDNAITRLDMLAQGDGLADLEVLDMQRNQLDDEGFIAWCDVAKKSTIRVLDVSENEIGDASLKALAHSPVGAALEIFHCSYTEVSDDGVCALASATMLARLEHVFFEGINLSPQTIEALVQSPFLSSLKTIQYGHLKCHRVRD